MEAGDRVNNNATRHTQPVQPNLLPEAPLSIDIRRSVVLALAAIAAIAAIWMVTGLVRLIKWRMYVRKLRAQGLPMPPHNLFFGHFLIIVRLVSQLPGDAHPVLLPDEIRRAYPDLGPNFYVDLAPFAVSMLVIGSPDMHYQIAQEHLLEKTMTLKNFVRPLTDGLDFLTMEYARWKKWRSIFNPGFSAAHLTTHIPVIVEATETLTQVLEERAKQNDVFALKRLTDCLTLDITGQIVLGTHLNCQLEKNRMIESLRTQIRWFSHGLEPNLFDRWNPARPLIQWYHSRIVNAYMSEEFDKRVNIVNQDLAAASSAKSSRIIIDMVIRANNEGLSSGNIGGSRVTMDPLFKKMCMSQIKLFLFSGHDTTSSAICYHIYLLSQHPDILKRVQDEHTEVFGSDVRQAASMIIESPHLLNQIPVTTAVIKESLRLFPPVTPSREGEQGFSIKDGHGRSYPTGNFLVFPCTQMIHHDSTYWPEAMSFIPDRWLVETDDRLYPVKGAWRGFEHGPRNCIGQELAMLEMKMALVMVTRRFVFKAAYDEVDGKLGKTSPVVHGEKAYQTMALQPRGDLPVRVEVLKN